MGDQKGEGGRNEEREKGEKVGLDGRVAIQLQSAQVRFFCESCSVKNGRRDDLLLSLEQEGGTKERRRREEGKEELERRIDSSDLSVRDSAMGKRWTERRLRRKKPNTSSKEGKEKGKKEGKEGRRRGEAERCVATTHLSPSSSFAARA